MRYLIAPALVFRKGEVSGRGAADCIQSAARCSVRANLENGDSAVCRSGDLRRIFCSTFYDLFALQTTHSGTAVT